MERDTRSLSPPVMAFVPHYAERIPLILRPFGDASMSFRRTEERCLA